MAETTIHPTAVVDPSAQLGTGVTVGPLAVVGAGVELGDGCDVGAGAQLQGPSSFGPRNRVFAHSCLGFEPQDLKYAGEPTRLEVGSDNLFREMVTVNRGTAGGGAVTRIGSHNLFMAYTHIAHDCQIGDRTVFSNCATLAGHVEVGDWAIIGAFCAVQQFSRIGQHAYIGGYSLLAQDAMPFVKTVGYKPAFYGLNRIGLQRRGFSDESIQQLEEALRLLTRSKLNTTQALERMRGELAGDPHVDHLIDFIASSQRGVIKSLPGRPGMRGGADE